MPDRPPPLRRSAPRRWGAAVVVTSLAVSALATTQPQLLARLVDAVARRHDWGPPILAWAIVTMLLLAGEYLSKSAQVRFRARARATLRAGVATGTLRGRPLVESSSLAQDVVSRTNNDVDVVVDDLFSARLALVASTGGLVLMSAGLWLLHPLYCAVVVLGSLLTLAAPMLFRRSIADARTRMLTATSAYNSRLGNVVALLPGLHRRGLMGPWLAHLDDRNRAVADDEIVLGERQARASILGATLSYGVLLLVLVTGAVLAASGTSSLGGLVAASNTPT